MFVSKGGLWQRGGTAYVNRPVRFGVTVKTSRKYTTLKPMLNAQMLTRPAYVHRQRWYRIWLGEFFGRLRGIFGLAYLACTELHQLLHSSTQPTRPCSISVSDRAEELIQAAALARAIRHETLAEMPDPEPVEIEPQHVPEEVVAEVQPQRIPEMVTAEVPAQRMTEPTIAEVQPQHVPEPIIAEVQLPRVPELFIAEIQPQYVPELVIAEIQLQHIPGPVIAAVAESPAHIQPTIESCIIDIADDLQEIRDTCIRPALDPADLIPLVDDFVAAPADNPPPLDLPAERKIDSTDLIPLVTESVESKSPEVEPSPCEIVPPAVCEVPADTAPAAESHAEVATNHLQKFMEASAHVHEKLHVAIEHARQQVAGGISSGAQAVGHASTQARSKVHHAAQHAQQNARIHISSQLIHLQRTGAQAQSVLRRVAQLAVSRLRTLAVQLSQILGRMAIWIVASIGASVRFISRLICSATIALFRMLGRTSHGTLGAVTQLALRSWRALAPVINRSLIKAAYGCAVVMVVCVSALWIRSWDYSDRVQLCSRSGRTLIYAGAVDGRLYLDICSYKESRPATSRLAWQVDRAGSRTFVLIRYRTLDTGGLLARGGWRFFDTATRASGQACIACIPFWILVVPSGAALTWHGIVGARRRRLQRRIARGLCLKCGYDLRASVSFCPACGCQIQSAQSVPQSAKRPEIKMVQPAFAG